MRKLENEVGELHAFERHGLSPYLSAGSINQGLEQWREKLSANSTAPRTNTPNFRPSLGSRFPNSSTHKGLPCARLCAGLTLHTVTPLNLTVSAVGG